MIVQNTSIITTCHKFCVFLITVFALHTHTCNIGNSYIISYNSPYVVVTMILVFPRYQMFITFDKWFEITFPIVSLSLCIIPG